MSNLINLGSNENLLGPSPQALAAVQAALVETHLYPGNQEAILIQKLAAYLGSGLSEAQFITGNGSCDVLRMIAHTLINPGGRAIVAAPTFGMYEVLVAMFEGQTIRAPLQDYTVDLPAILDRLDETVDLIFICNPNNPTGTMITHSDVQEFLQRLPSNVVVVFDEAYMEFADDPNFPRMLDFIRDGYRIVVTRTFSKLYGLASLRLGYGIGPPDLMADIRKRKLHFNSGRPAYVGAAAALADDDFRARSLEMVSAGRRFFYRELENLGLTYLPSQSNFIFLLNLPLDAAFICQEAAERGIIIRQTDSFGLPNNIRITIGRQADNERVIEVLREIVGGQRVV